MITRTVTASFSERLGRWIRATLVALLVATPAVSYGFHFPWDQGHDTTDWDDPPDEGPCEGPQCDPCSSTGSPVYIPTGHLIWTETDASISGMPPLSLTRTYNSNDPRDGLFGRGWTTNCDAALLQYVGTEFDENNNSVQVSGYVLRATDGKRYSFRRSAGGVVSAPSGRHERVVPQSNGAVQVFTRGGSSRTYSSGGRLVAASSAGGHVLSYSYDAGGRLQRITNPAGRFIAFTYNSRGRVETVSDSANRTWSYAYDTNGNLISITNPAGGVRRYDYQAYSPPGDGHTYYQLTRITDESGIVVTNVSYSSGRVASYTEGENRYSYTYNTVTRTVNKTDTLGSQWIYTYTDAGTVASVRDPLGNMERFEFDADGNTTRYIDQLQQEWRWTYDDRGRALSSTDPAGQQWAFAYQGELPNPITSTSPSGRITRATYGIDGKLTELLDPAQARTTLAYDANQNLRETRDALGNVTAFTADSSGLPITVRDALGRVMTFGYDSSGRLTSLAHADGSQRTIEYGPLGLPSLSIGPDGARTATERNTAGRLVSITDPSGRITRYEYDTFGRMSARVMSDGRRYEFRYRADNLVDRVIRPDGIAETYNYDSAKRLLSRSAGAETVTYAYDARSDLVTATNSAQTTTLGYDDIGRHISEAGGGQTVAYSYNNEGERTAIQFIGGIVTLSIDARGVVTGVSAPEGDFAFSYDELMRRTQLTYPNGTVTSYSYDATHQLTQVQSSGPFSHSLTYTRNTRGQVSGVTAGQGQASWSYGYASDGRLSDATSALGTFDYQYDAAGNLLGAGRTYDTGNRLLQDDQFTYSYDVMGNLTQKVDRASGARTIYGWNAWNQLVSVQSFADGSSTQPIISLSYTYDALDRRLTRSENGVTQRYVYDGLNRIATLDASGTVIERTTFGPNIDEPLALAGPQGQRYLHANHLGSVIGVSGAASTLARYDYAPYGRLLPETPADGNSYRFTGREFETQDLYYYRARYYDAGAGRFISEDPVGLQGGANLYAYVNGDPLNEIDPSGQCPWCIGAGIGLGIELVSQLVQNGGNFGCLDWGQLAAATAMGAIGGGIGSRGLVSAAKGLSNGAKGRIGETLSLANNWLKGSRLVSTQTRSIPGHNTIVDSTWRSISGSTYYVESKFGTAGLTRAQRAAANALGDRYHVERWGYDFVGNVGAGAGGAAGGAAGGSIPTGKRDCECQ